jgi:4-hydroxybenzoate polyprenyltransferase
MNHIRIFIQLTRLTKPIGFMLLFWPCAFGLIFSYKNNSYFDDFFFYLFLFFLGSVLMRSAGCIFNDIVDKDVDRKVHRTRNRPLAAGLISVKKSFIYVCTLCVAAFFVLIQFNGLTILLGLSSMFLAFAYPFMKRITYWPQLFLGLTFNWGILMGWSSINPIMSLEIILLYLSAIFWTLGYDTIYGLQDINDDEIIGMKSTSIKFKNNPKLFVGSCYLVSSLLLSFLFQNYINLNLFTAFFIFFIISLIYQIYIFDKNKSNTCLFAFKLNNFSGLLLFISICCIKL